MNRGLPDFEFGRYTLNMEPYELKPIWFPVSRSSLTVPCTQRCQDNLVDNNFAIDLDFSNFILKTGNPWALSFMSLNLCEPVLHGMQTTTELCSHSLSFLRCALRIRGRQLRGLEFLSKGRVFGVVDLDLTSSRLQ
jgi:hypothetical protein